LLLVVLFLWLIISTMPGDKWRSGLRELLRSGSIYHFATSCVGKGSGSGGRATSRR